VNNSAKNDIKSTFREYVEAIIIAVILALCIRTFVVQAFKIPSGSMEPTLLVGDHILVNKFTYGIKIPFFDYTIFEINNPQPNDVIVFKYPNDPKIDYIKRVIAVEGDTVEIINKKILVNGEALLNEHGVYTDPDIHPRSQDRRDNMEPITVPKGKLFVMGDNRDHSYDSRFWNFVDLDAVRGKAFLIYWSWDVRYPLLSVDRFASIKLGRVANSIN